MQPFAVDRRRTRAPALRLVPSVAVAALFLAAAAFVTAPSSADEHAYTNRLIDSNNPYLLLHAHNPVDWYPWGPEALDKAKRENKPIFLSIGYSTCYWCHVAERTLFSNPADREADERLVRQHQGRPRGAAGSRRRLYARHPAHHEPARAAGRTICS